MDTLNKGKRSFKARRPATGVRRGGRAIGSARPAKTARQKPHTKLEILAMAAELEASAKRALDEAAQTSRDADAKLQAADAAGVDGECYLLAAREYVAVHVVVADIHDYAAMLRSDAGELRNAATRTKG